MPACCAISKPNAHRDSDGFQIESARAAATTSSAKGSANASANRVSGPSVGATTPIIWLPSVAANSASSFATPDHAYTEIATNRSTRRAVVRSADHKTAPASTAWYAQGCQRSWSPASSATSEPVAAPIAHRRPSIKQASSEPASIAKAAASTGAGTSNSGGSRGVSWAGVHSGHVAPSSVASVAAHASGKRSRSPADAGRVGSVMTLA